MSENDSGARCDRHVGEVYPPRCSECDAARSSDTTTDLTVELAEVSRGLELVTWGEDGKPWPRDREECRVAIHRLMQSLSQAEHPSDARAAIEQVHAASGSRAYTEIVTFEAVTYWVGLVLAGGPADEIARVSRNFTAIATAYRATRPVGAAATRLQSELGDPNGVNVFPTDDWPAEGHRGG